MDKKNGGEARRRAYAAGARMSKERMAREAPLDAAALEAVGGSDIVVVEGCYDHVERVLDALELPYTTCPRSARPLPLRAEQLLVVNCPGTRRPGPSRASATSSSAAGACSPPTGRCAT